MATLADVTDILNKLGKAYPHQCTKWSATDWRDTYHVYAGGLADIPADALKMAAMHWASTEKWFPALSELRDTVFGFQERADGLPTPEEAWQEARRLVGRRAWWNADRTVLEPRDVQVSDCSHPLVFEAICRMGLEDLRNSDNDVADRAHFWRVYESCRSRQREDVRMLPGVREQVDRLGDGRIRDGVKQLAERMRLDAAH